MSKDVGGSVGVTSDVQVLLSGVPHGSIIGSLVLTMYINLFILTSNKYTVTLIL